MAAVTKEKISNVSDLESLSKALRLSILNVHRTAGGGHLGSSLSIVEILITLFHRHFRWDRSEGNAQGGDRFVLSKGHAALGLYCLLESLGHIASSNLASFGKNGSPLEPHPNERLEHTIHASTGSLGQGMSIGIGLALGSFLRGTSDRTFVLIGDGEANEGQIWEAARSAARLKLSNLIVILDDNGMQQDGPTTEILPVSDIFESWHAMGWNCVSADGHNCEELEERLLILLNDSSERPKLLYTTTVKGRGVPFLEGDTESHYPPPLTDEDMALVKYMIETGGIYV